LKAAAILLAGHGNIKFDLEIVSLQGKNTTMKRFRGLVHWLQAVILCL
jgi:hypothetical protein